MTLGFIKVISIFPRPISEQYEFVFLNLIIRMFADDQPAALVYINILVKGDIHNVSVEDSRALSSSQHS